MHKSLMNFLAGLQSLLGGVGVLGIVLYLLERESNRSRYQLLALPFWAVIFALPLIVLSLVTYRRHSAKLSTVERGVFYLGCFLPIVTFCIAMILPEATR